VYIWYTMAQMYIMRIPETLSKTFSNLRHEVLCDTKYSALSSCPFNLPNLFCVRIGPRNANHKPCTQCFADATTVLQQGSLRLQGTWATQETRKVFALGFTRQVGHKDPYNLFGSPSFIFYDC
jgi:hypothetical protein